MSLPPRLRRFFRPARGRATTLLLLETGLQTAVFWVTFLAILPAAIMAAEHALGLGSFAFPCQRAVGGGLFVVASVLNLATGATMAVAGRGTPLPTACPRRLVVAGPYRHIRNPMAVAGLAQGAAVGLAFGSWGILAYVLAGGLLWNFWVRPVEEADLEERFGASFARYRSAVRCWVPRIRGYHAASEG